MWQNYFRVIKVLPGKIIMPGFGQVDLSNPNIPLKRIQDLFEADCPYLEPTPLALSELYGHKEAPSPKPQVPSPKEQPVPTFPEPVEEPIPDPIKSPIPKPATRKQRKRKKL